MVKRKLVRQNQYHLWLLIMMIAGYALFFSAQNLLHFYSFGARSTDLGSMDQAVWNTLHGQPFAQTVNPFVNSRLSLHVEPILLPISLLYLLYSGPETLLIFESIVVALGALPVYALAQHKLHNRILPLAFALVYLMFPAIQGANMVEFHPITLTPTFLLAAFYFLEVERPWLFGLFAGLAMACKEDMSLVIFLMGFYALVIKHRHRLGIITMGLSLLWAFVAVFVIPQTFVSTENIHWNRYGHLGENPLDIVLNLFHNPKLFVDQLITAHALNYLWLLLMPTAYLTLLNPVTLLFALPSLGINLLSNFTPMQEVNRLIYAAPLVPAVLISSILGAANLKKWLSRFSMLTPSLIYTGLAIVIIAASLFYHRSYGFFPGGGQFRGWEEITAHHHRAGQLFFQIPPQAVVSAQDRLVPHLSQREKIYIFDRIDDADYIAFDVTDDSWPLHPIQLRHRIDDLLDGEFGIVDALDGYLLLARNQTDSSSTLPDAFFDFTRVPNPQTFQPRYPVSVVFDNKLHLLGYDVGPDLHGQGQVIITMYWQALEPLDQDYMLWPFVINQNGEVIDDTSQRPLVSTIWYPTSRWSPEEIIITRTLPRDYDEPFTPAVGVTRQDWADSEQRLPITTADETRYTFDHNTWARLATVQRDSSREFSIMPTPDDAQPSQPHQAIFGERLHLLGVDMPNNSLRVEQDLDFTLHWQTDVAIPVNLTTFAHLVDQEGNLVAQLDWTPQDSWGYLPTTAWQPGRPVLDREVLTLPEALVPGEYRLIAGWYNSQTGERIPVTHADSGDGADFVLIGTVTVR